MHLTDIIAHYVPSCGQEESDKPIILDLVSRYGGNILLRDTEFAHITSSGLVFNRQLDKVLMVHHNIYNTWAWTGGHADGDDDLLHVAIKEAMEETGITEVRPLFPDIISLDILPVWGHIKKNQYVSSHLHLSVAYALSADENCALTIKPDENSGVRWIGIPELDKCVDEPYMLGLYKKIIVKTKVLSSHNQ